MIRISLLLLRAVRQLGALLLDRISIGKSPRDGKKAAQNANTDRMPMPYLSARSLALAKNVC